MHTTFSIETTRTTASFDNTKDHRAYVAIAAIGTVENMHNFLNDATEINASSIKNFSQKGIKFMAKVGTLQGNAPSTHSSRMGTIAYAIDSGERNCPFATILHAEKSLKEDTYIHIFCYPIAPISLKKYNAAEAEAKASIACEKAFDLIPTNKNAHFAKSENGPKKRKTPMKFQSNPFE